MFHFLFFSPYLSYSLFIFLSRSHIYVYVLYAVSIFCFPPFSSYRPSSLSLFLFISLPLFFLIRTFTSALNSPLSDLPSPGKVLERQPALRRHLSVHLVEASPHLAYVGEGRTDEKRGGESCVCVLCVCVCVCVCVCACVCVRVEGRGLTI